MNNAIESKHIDVVILCGGLGKRLPQVTKDMPKSMAKIKNKPFLDFLIKQVLSYGFRRFILCTGYKSDLIEDYYRNKNNEIEMVFSREEQPLGTGGAIKNAQKNIKSDIFLVMNGDSFCNIDLRKFLHFHVEKKALASIALTSSRKINDVGLVRINDKQGIINFSEKSNKQNNGYVNAGIYFFNKQIFNYPLNKYKFSLEYDLFPNLISKGIYGFVVNSELVDIGTPERYEKAKILL